MRAARGALLVLLLLGLFMGVLYRRAVGIGVLSDGWVLLEIGNRGLLEAPKVMLSYHTIPVTNFFSAVMWRLFGFWERGYQLANLASMTLIAWLVYLLGCRLFRQPRIGLLAALLFLANSSFYEVPFWPVIGNFQSLAAFFYIAGIFAVHQAVRSARPWPWLGLFALALLAGVFTYEPTLSMLFVAGVLAALWPGRDGLALPWRQRLRRVAGVGLAALPVLALIALVKARAVSAGGDAMFLPDSLWMLRYRLHLLVRAVIAIFTLRGSDPALYQILSFRQTPALYTPLYHALLGGWLLFLAGLGAFLALKVKEPAVRLLTLWTAIHLAFVAAAANVVSRHFYLAAIPGMLLLAWAIWSLADRAAEALDRTGVSAPFGLNPAQAAATLALIPLAFLVAGAKNDLNAAAAIHRVATQATRQMAALVEARLPTLQRLALINMPAAVAEDGVSSFLFINGPHQMLYLKSNKAIRIDDVKLFHTYDRPDPGEYANVSVPIGLDELTAMIRDPGAVVLMFDRRSRTVRELDRAGWETPERYTPDTAPYLEWQSGAWPWLRLYAGQPLKLPLAREGETSWAAVQYLRTPETSFTVEAGGPAPLFAARPGPVAAPAWPTALFPLPQGADGMTLSPAAELWIGEAAVFSPQAEYTAEAAPFLEWMSQPEAAFIVQAPMRFPLASEACLERPCAVEVEFLAEPGRELSLALGDGPPRAFSFAGAPAWRAERLETGAPGAAVLRITPTGRSPVFVRKLAFTAFDKAR